MIIIIYYYYYSIKRWTDIENILKIADKYQLTSAGNVWIINDEILKNIELATFRNGNYI